MVGTVEEGEGQELATRGGGGARAGHKRKEEKCHGGGVYTSVCG